MFLSFFFLSLRLILARREKMEYRATKNSKINRISLAKLKIYKLFKLYHLHTILTIELRFKHISHDRPER